MEILNQPLYPDSIELWALAFILASVVAGLLLHIGFLWRIRVALTALNLCLIGISLGLILVSGVAPWLIGGVVLIQSYRMFSFLRIIQNRVNREALHRKSSRTDLVLSLALLSLLVLSDSSLFNMITNDNLIFVLVSIQFIVAYVFVATLRYMKSLTEPKLPFKHLPDIDLPSLTVAIPARNETNELTECLESVLASDYPKLEILVVDDCSQDNTSDIIRHFAHRGVRFIAGKTPPTSWLAKNFAYHQLLDEAGGKYILFCGTDVRFEKQSLRKIIEIQLQHGHQMISVLPLRTHKDMRHSLLQTMRYWRELAIPRLFDKTPPVLSTCWVTERKFLESNGGFAAHKKTIRPERIFSRIAKVKHAYAFNRSGKILGISSIKNSRAQWNTAVRTRYPELKNRPENIFFFTLLYALLIIGTPLAMLYGIVTLQMPIIVIAGISLSMLGWTHLQIYYMTTNTYSLRTLILLPLAGVMEIVVSNYSMWAYEYSEVIWKGRNVCIPVLQTVSKLPDMPSPKVESNSE